MSCTHVIGAGMAGLAAAVSLARSGHAVVLYESSGQAGGRCRSFFDAKLACTIDNGNHLLLSGNRAVKQYLDDIDATAELAGPASARFPFIDLSSGRSWCLEPGPGRIPWWLCRAGRRVPDTAVWDYLSALRLAFAGPDRTVTDCIGDQGPLFDRFWEPLTVAVLNTPARSAAAHLLWPVLMQTFGRGEAACRPRVARAGLSQTFVEPALTALREAGAAIRFGLRLGRIDYAHRRARALDFGSESVQLGDADSVVLALPPARTADLVPNLTVPRASHPIVNAHFRLDEPAELPFGSPFLGLIGGTAQWLFTRGNVASITISAADAVADHDSDVIARKTWADVAAALERDPDRVPVYRVVKERRATFAQTPADAGLRPPTRSAFANLHLAGDWTATGLPATIEGALQSGYAAAAVIRDGDR